MTKLNKHGNRILFIVYAHSIFFLIIGLALSIISIPILFCVYMIVGAFNGGIEFTKEYTKVINTAFLKTTIEAIEKRYMDCLKK